MTTYSENKFSTITFTLNSDRFQERNQLIFLYSTRYYHTNTNTSLNLFFLESLSDGIAGLGLLEVLLGRR